MTAGPRCRTILLSGLVATGLLTSGVGRAEEGPAPSPVSTLETAADEPIVGDVNAGSQASRDILELLRPLVSLLGYPPDTEALDRAEETGEVGEVLADLASSLDASTFSADDRETYRCAEALARTVREASNVISGESSEGNRTLRDGRRARKRCSAYAEWYLSNHEERLADADGALKVYQGRL